MGKPTEEAPKIEEVAAAPAVILDEDTPPTAPVAQTGITSVKFKDTETVSIADMLNAKGEFVSELMISRIEQHMEYLSGKKGFGTDKARLQEQITFIETIGGSTTLDIDQYCVVTDYLLKVIRENLSKLNHGQMFRFLRGLKASYSDKAIEEYVNYMTLLLRIAGSYADRVRVFQKVDLDSLTKGLSPKARDNINTYVRRLCQ